MIKDKLQQAICNQLCSDIQLIERENGKLILSTPFVYPDGDNYSIYIKENDSGTIRISDEANTMMRLSYENKDVDGYFKGHKGKLMEQILREHQVLEEQGNFYIDISIQDFSQGIFALGQALTEIYSLSYLDIERVKNPFYQNLEILLTKLTHDIGIDLNKNYQIPDIENAENYTIDYSLQNKDKMPLFLFGIPTEKKAMLVTITLQHLFIEKYSMCALIVYQNQQEFPPKDASRLADANIGGSQVSALKETPIKQNIEKHFRLH